jgi:tetratricopeptide (TPR) repeat protein
MPALMRRGLAASFAVAALAMTATAGAQGTGSSTYFAEGQRLMKEGKYAEACPQFEKALTLNPGAGTKFNLAECYEKTGRLASAFGLFREVESVTRQVGQSERSAAAKERADSLEPRTPTVIVRAPWTSSLPQATIALDGKPLSFNDVEKPIKVDFGKHEAIARAGTNETRAEAVIDKEGESKALVLAAPGEAIAPTPSGQTDAQPTPHADPPAEASAPGSSRRTIGLVVGGVGAAALGVGAFVVLGAKSSYDNAIADSKCQQGINGGLQCPSDRATEANDARSQANVGGIVMGIGAGALIGGLVLFFTAPSSRPAASVRIVPGAPRADIGLSTEASF